MAISKVEIPDWQPSGGELEIFYDPKQRELYKKEPLNCIYDQWPLREGRYNSSFEFPVMVAVKHYRDLGTPYGFLTQESQMKRRSSFSISQDTERAKGLDFKESHTSLMNE
jgi:hypothetical protein